MSLTRLLLTGPWHSPPKDVAWGEQTFNEMLSAYIAYSLVGSE